MRAGRLPRSVLDGAATGEGYLEDYAFLTAGLLDLFEATGDPRWLARALALQDVLDAHFADPAGGYFRTADDAESLLIREKPDFDGAEPSGNSVALENLLRLHEWTADERFRERADGLLRAFGAALARAPRALAHVLCGLDVLPHHAKEIVVVTAGDGSAEPFLGALRQRFVPTRVLVVVAEGAPQRALATTVP